MELKTHPSWRKIAVSLYVVAFLVYLIYGLQPVEASNYSIDNELYIPGIDLTADVTTLELDGNKLNTPDTIVGSFSMATNKTLLIGHSSTVLGRLHELNLGDIIYYDSNEYKVISIGTLLKDSVNMDKILASEERDTVVLMTCAGEDLGGGDATHRLIVTAIR